MEINKTSCCLFKNNPNIHPITKDPLTNKEKKEWLKKCKDYMSNIDDESIQSLKNTDIFSPRTNILISLSEKPPISKVSKKPYIELSSSEEEVEIIEVSKPTYPPVEMRTSIIPSTEEERPSSSKALLNDFYIKINSNLIFEDSILEKLNMSILKDILKNQFINVNYPNIIKSFNDSINLSINFQKILLNKELMIKFIKFLKDIEYKNNIKPNINDYIFNIISSTKIKLSGESENLINDYLQRKKKPILIEKPSIPSEYSDFTSENISNNFELLKKRAEMVNSDNFLYELNIKSINNVLYKKKYDEQNYIFLFKLFWKSSDILKPDKMPDFIYNLLYVNKNIEDYKRISINILKKDKISLDDFIELYLNFLNYIKTRPFNKYIPPNLNKYIKKQEGAVAIEPLPIPSVAAPSSSKTKARESPTRKKPIRSTSPEVQIISKEKTPESSKEIIEKRKQIIQKYKQPEKEGALKYFYQRGVSKPGVSKPGIVNQPSEEIYTPVSPTEPYKPISPVYSTIQPTQSSPPYVPVSPTEPYTPISPVYSTIRPAQISPPYVPTSPNYPTTEYSPPYQPTDEPISTSSPIRPLSSKLVGLPSKK